MRPPTPHIALGRNTPPTFNTRTPPNTNQGRLVACQICGKYNHTALDCYHRMDYTYQGRHPPSQLSHDSHNHTDFDNHEWLANSDANTHVAADPTTINNPQPFEGAETVGVGNEAGLDIKSFGSSVVQLTHSLSLLNFFSKTFYIVPLSLQIYSPLINFVLTTIVPLN